MELADADVEPVVERRLLAISLSILTLLTAATLVAEREAFVDLFDSQDQREGVSAFLAKRAPVWRNA